MHCPPNPNLTHPYSPPDINHRGSADRFMKLNRPLMAAVDKVGYLHPTPVQAQVIRPVMNGMDVCVRAVTGSGKTAAFALPMINILMQPRDTKPTSVRGLVLEPTREVAFQCQNMFRQLAKSTKVTTAVCQGIGNRDL